MNGDGVVDLVAPNRGGGVAVMLGQGDGIFDQPRSAARPGQNGEELGDSVVGDFDADGVLDLAVGFETESTLLVLRGLGDGHLDTADSYVLAAPLETLTMADLNGDGDQDLLAVASDAGVVDVLLGGTGTGFTAAAPVAVGAFPRGLDVADLDGDGSPDFAVANRGSDTVSLRYGDATGRFPAGAELPTRPVPQDVELTDLGGDGVVDLIVGSNDDPLADNGTLAVLRGSGPAQFTEIRSYETLKFINSVTAADFDEDGYLDFVIGTGNNAPLGFGEPAPGYLTVVGGRPGSATQIVVSHVGSSARDVVVADLDGDADLDVVTARGLTYVAIVFDPLG
ncbi:MAG: VCBS repeat-containing protein [Geodermatophilaceae bacterium]|nr:VCBS repeat-containing protein [Geodermatophilaceae bacterium]